MDAVNAELSSLDKMRTWDIVPLPTGKRRIGSGWVFKLKRTSSGEIDKFKARVVARGNTQRAGIDFNDTYAPVARISTVRVVLAVAASFGMTIQHMDVSTAFLNGILELLVASRTPGFRNTYVVGRFSRRRGPLCLLGIYRNVKGTSWQIPLLAV